MQVPGEADAAMHRLRSKLNAGAGPRGLPPAVTAALECDPLGAALVVAVANACPHEDDTL